MDADTGKKIQEEMDEIRVKYIEPLEEELEKLEKREIEINQASWEAIRAKDNDKIRRLDHELGEILLTKNLAAYDLFKLRTAYDELKNEITGVRDLIAAVPVS